MVVLDMISLNYSETLSAAAGYSMEEAKEQTIEAGTTVQGIVDKGLATPTAGNLIAVDGSVAQQGGGTAFTATVNGADAQGDQKLSAGDQVQIDNGQDVDEDFTETTETIPHGESGTDYSTLASYYNGAIHVYSSGEDGEKTVKTGNVSGKTVEEVTKQPTDAGYSSYNANVGDDKVLALTFDDGPWPNQTAETSSRKTARTRPSSRSATRSPRTPRSRSASSPRATRSPPTRGTTQQALARA